MAAKFKISVNKKRLLQEVVISKGMNVVVAQAMQPIVNNAQEKMVEEFNQHPITREINSGPDANNSSGTLGGYGNLFSFLGFYYSSDPTAPIYEILKKKISVSSVRNGENGKFIVYLNNAPNKEEIFKATPFTWLSGRSWVDGIEKGVSGLGRYIYSEANFNSRSESGIQIKGKAANGTFKNSSYISTILNNFRKNLIL